MYREALSNNDPFITLGYPPEFVRYLQELAEELGHVPAREEVASHPDPIYDLDVYDRLFDDGYEEAKEKLKIDKIQDNESARGYNISTDELIEEVRRLGERVGRTPRTVDMKRHGKYSVKTYYNRFDGGWEDILERAGYGEEDVQDYGEPSKVEADTLIQDVQNVAAKVGRPPSMKEYKKHGSYHPSTIADRFGDEDTYWRGALMTICEQVDDDVLTSDEIRKQGGEKEIPPEALRKDVEYVKALLGHPPNAKEYEKWGSHSSGTVANRFGSGSWPAAMEALFGKYSSSPDSAARAG